MLLTLLQNRSDTPPQPSGGSNAGFVMGGGQQVAREVYRKPLLQRVLEARAPKVKPPKERAAKRAKDIEVRAAQIAVQGIDTQAIDRLAREWAAQKPYIPESAQSIPLQDLFYAQIAFRIAQLGMLQEQDEEEAIITLLLS